MAGRKKLIVGNWKMNLNIHEASLYVHKLSQTIKSHRNVEVVIAPTSLAMQSISLQIDRRQFKLAAQNFYWRDDGAFTGEVSANQLRGLVEYALVGHSERRHIFHESEKDIRSKVQAAIRNDISPILCVGETAHERSENETKDVLHDQLTSGLANVTSEDLKHVVIAYEPVWAISNGTDFAHHKTPTPEDITQIAKVIRNQIKHLYGDDASREIMIIYGASVNADNAADFLAVEGIDGLLPGGASLNLSVFNQLVELAHKSAGKEKTA